MSLLVLMLCLQQANLSADPAQAQVGQPVTWTMVVDHDVDESVELESLAGLADDTWVLLSGPDVARTRDGERASTRIQWSYFSLEAGDRALPSVQVSLTSGLSVEALAGYLEVIGDLGIDEDAPRPVGGPLVPPEGSEVSGPSAWYLLPIPLILFFVLLRRMGRKGVPDPASLPPVDLVELLATAPDHGDFAAALSLRIREAFDAEQGAARAALLDSDWIQDVRARGGIESAHTEEAEQLLAWADTVEFGRVQPSKFALTDALTRTQAILAGSQEQGDKP